MTLLQQNMETLHARHRKEIRDLQSQVTQKKKAANKKNRKAVNVQCEYLEQDLKSKHEREAAELSGVTLLPGDAHTLEGLIEPDDLEERPGSVQNEEKLVGDTSDPLPSAGSESLGQEQSTPQKKQNRQKARLARRAAEQDAVVAQAAEEAANLPDLKDQERASMQNELDRLGLQEFDIRPDGHCMYSAVADQLKGSDVLSTRSGPEPYQKLRRLAAQYISEHPDDFVPFLEEPLESYVHKIRNTAEWGGQLELMALAKACKVEINVVQANARIETIDPGEEKAQKIWLAYYKHHFGLGEHYNSLKQK